MNISNDDVIIQIFLLVPIKNISTLCQTCTRFNIIISDNNFWKERFIHEYGFLNRVTVSWLSMYRNYNIISFGSNKFGQLGLNTKEVRTINPQWETKQILSDKLGYPENLYNPTIIPKKFKFIACGQLYTMMIDLQDDVWVCGENEYGQLGLAETKIRCESQRLGNMKAKSISCGYAHTMIIDMDDNIWGMGYNKYGQLGLGDIENRNVPVLMSWNPGNQNKVKDVKCGEYHTIILDLNNNIWSFGRNLNGQLGLGDTKSRIIPTQINTFKLIPKSICCGGFHSFIVDSNDNIWTFGNNIFGQLGLGDIEDRHTLTLLSIKIKQIACGGFHTVIISLHDDVWVFGNNQYGQLGLGDNEYRYDPYLLSKMKVRNIACGYLHTIILDLEGGVWSFGNNNYNQLGLDDNKNRNIPIQLQGINAKSAFCGVAHSIVISDPN
jgi:alpha-tubulin suppressor-like RCC1 family protein